MALKEMWRALNAEAKKQRETVIQRAHREASHIVKEAEKAGQEIKERARAEVKSMLEVERGKVLNEARLYLGRELRKAREKLVDEVFAAAKKRLESLRESADYPGILRHFIEEVATEGSGGNFAVSVDKRDEALARELLDKMKKHYTLDTDISTAGGVRVTTGKGRIILTNTVEVRLERASEFLRGEIADILFE
jgi:vacuolar-type H+-ATPase subunit E/Vma4